MMIYDRLATGQFLVKTQIKIMAVDRKDNPIFFGKLEGRLVLFHSDFYYLPIAQQGMVLDSDVRSRPENTMPGTSVHAVCENVPRGSRAVRWCKLEDYQACVCESERQKEGAAKREAEVKELQRQHQAELEERRERQLTENPKTVTDALAHGWEVVKDDGKQVILAQHFPGEKHSRRITRYLPPTPAKLPKPRSLTLKCAS